MFDFSKVKPGDKLVCEFEVKDICQDGDIRMTNNNTIAIKDHGYLKPPLVLKHKPGIHVGEIYRYSGYDHTVVAVVGDKEKFAVVSIDGFIQTNLVPVERLMDKGIKCAV